MIGDAARQLDGGGVGNGARIDFGQREGGMLRRDDEIARDHDFEAAAEGQTVDRGDHRLVETGEFLEAAESAHAIIAVGRLAFRRRLQIPAGAEEFLPRRREDRHAQLGIVAEASEDIAHDAARCGIDGIGLGPVDGDFEDGAAALGADGGHGVLMRIRASTATALSASTSRGLMSSSSMSPR